MTVNGLQSQWSYSSFLPLERKAIKSLSDGLFESTATIEKPNYVSPDGIVRFVRDVIGAHPTPYQEDILGNFVEKRRASARGPHGLGKTALLSWIALWGVTVFEEDSKVVTTAGAWRQLTKFLWPEVHKWAARADWSKLGLQMRRGKELLEYGIKLPGNREAFAVASDNPALIEGAHASHLVYILDESKAISVETFDAVEGAFASGDCYAIALSTPGPTSGRFYDIHKRKPGLTDWWARHVTVDEAIAAGQVSADWVEQRREQWGETSPVFQNRVLGEFAESGENIVVPLSWCERAVERFHERGGKGDGKIAFGVDPAYTGDDKTTIARLVGTVIEHIEAHSHEDPMQTAGRVAAQIGGAPAGIDVIGIGAGVYARLRELGYKNAIAVNVSEATDMTDESGEIGFENLRAAIWWMMRDALNPNNTDAIAIPPDYEDLLVGDLTAPVYTYTSRGRIKVESKDDMRKRIGRSTDYADAVGLALYAQRGAGRRKRFEGVIA